MISLLQKKYNVDTTQIFISGLSTGAAMSIVMSATHPQLLKAQPYLRAAHMQNRQPMPFRR
ncbi:MAG: hypothetical protein IPM51_17475 [Sphingobacteriaceae bacterium]|nr:hypothetical protein [Sphingobacteriaceae bacterium]